ncbi:hypothetical protein BB559_003233 [Furculomyces boomerangus]|uniref:SGNH hydrolase-type esterase domain-containing protein n=1 Tax=Furculomyces boomerangus TaxID=61424 RepID=A0A2T9YMP9_9FUNG|nr:hypothetical protein BB559_003233 [Furculomyces boomerangus]
MKLIGSIAAASLLIAPVLSVQPYLFAFGDSLSDNGNTAIQDNNIPYWNNRMSNGPVWNEYAAYFNRLKLVNYAHEGSVTDNDLIASATGIKVGVPSLKDQISRFSATFKNITTPEILAKSIASITIGSNDLKAIATLGSSKIVRGVSAADAAIKSMIRSIDTLHSLGFRNIIFSNFPQPGDVPAVSINSKLESLIASISTRLSNICLSEKVNILNAGYKDKFKKFTIIDLHKTVAVFKNSGVMDVTNIRNTTVGCFIENKDKNLVSKCNNPEGYYFFDSAHPTAIVHAVVGAIVSEALISSKGYSVSPEIVKNLVSKYKLHNVYSGSGPNLNQTFISVLKEKEYNMAEAESNYQKIIQDITS